MDYFYWTLSTSAQAVAAIMGLLIAAQVFNYSGLESLKNECLDASEQEELEDIIPAIQQETKKSFLIVLAACAVTISISITAMALANLLCSIQFFLTSLIVALTIGSIILSARFAYRIIDPNKTVREAQKIARDSGTVSDSSEGDPIEYLRTFIELEILLRDTITSLYKKDDKEFDYVVDKYVPNPRNRENISYRKSVEILNTAKLLDADLAAKLMEASRIRNYIVHGKIDKIEQSQNDNVKMLLNETKKVLDKRTGREGFQKSTS